MILLSWLASCILATLRMYINRKGWDTTSSAVNTTICQATKDGKTTTIIDRDIVFITCIEE